MILTYAHAISDPFIPASVEAEKGIKPFQIRKVSGDLRGYHDGEGWNVFFRLETGEELPGAWSENQDEAIEDAVFNAEYCLMDRSRQPWKK